ncbi:MAG TPA: tetratricopeptide repeat protein [Candidatus Dormibacteraeota bacterium]|nr:tetratricopeptide repeat protein [Candidatus Dormibacteraeota bacterium]
MAEKTLNELPRELRMLFTKGDDALSRENFDYAITLFTQILSKEPANYEVRRKLRGAQLRKAGDGGGLFKKMWGATKSQPMVTKGQLALRNNPAEALEIAEQVLNNDPQNSFAHRIVVEAASALQMPRTAVMSLEILAGGSPKDRELAMKFANALADSGEIVRAEKILADLVASFPADQDLSLALKNISARKTMEKGGYDALAEGKGSYRDILRNKDEAVSLEQQNRQVKSEDTAERLIKEYEERLKADPNNLKLLRDLAELYTQKQKFDVALSYYERIKASDTGAGDASLDKGIADTMRRKFDYQISQIDPTAPDHADQLAKIQAEKQAYSLAECQKRVERFPTDPQIRFELGQLYFEAGKIGEAIPEFQRAQQNPHRKAKAMSYLGQCYARRNMNDLAVRTFEASLKEKLIWDDEKKEIAYNLGVTLEKMGKRDEAKHQFEEIYGVDSSFRDVSQKMDQYYGG